MDGLALLRRAQEAGLRLEVADTALKITGPKEAEPLVRLLAEHKAQVLEALTSGQRRGAEIAGNAENKPEGPQGDLPQSAEEEVRRDRFEERAKRKEVNDHDLLASNQLDTYEQVFAALRSQCPQLIDPDRWQQAIQDADSFLATWGAQAQAFGWTARELFGLHPIPSQPAPSYERLARYDATGLIWLLRGRPVIALTASEAAIRGHDGGIVTYRKHNKPALGPLGDSLDDMGPQP
jgi:hypothetical protein